MQLSINSEAEMVDFGVALAKACQDHPCHIDLQGDLGAGKTTLVRGFLKYYDHQGPVKSPTYTLVEPYQFEGHIIYHFDLYRIAHPEEVEFMGLRDYFVGQAWCLVEWPEKAQGILPVADVVIKINYSNTLRQVELIACSDIGRFVQTHLHVPPGLLS